MDLETLLKDYETNKIKKNPQIRGLTLHSRKVTTGDAFFAIKGEKADGRLYIEDAIKRGAAAIIMEKKGKTQFDLPKKCPTPIVWIKDLASHLSEIASRFYQHPSHTLKVIGVTGTNGKTTTTHLLTQALSQCGLPTGMMGTVGYGFGHFWEKSDLTTSDPITVQRRLAHLRQLGAKAVVMEVSSHGLVQDRVKAVRFCSAHFTNLTPEHLDYHGDMESYAQAKALLFKNAHLHHVVVNADSEYMMHMIDALEQDIPVACVSRQKNIDESQLSHLSKVEKFTVQQADFNELGIQAEIKYHQRGYRLQSKLMGEFNLSNLLGVIAECVFQQFDIQDIIPIIKKLSAPQGRMEKVGGGASPLIIVDYAHTPDALENALTTARGFCQRKLWCVFGCGGERDEYKRSKMGAIASSLADHVVITNDNPRSEPPQQIIQGILSGIEAAHYEKIVVEEDRKEAIAYAISHALAIDVILIAGKGHENYQIINNKRIAFSDIAVARKILGENHAIITDSQSA